jgi:hypothetical protein
MTPAKIKIFCIVRHANSYANFYEKCTGAWRINQKWELECAHSGKYEIKNDNLN